MAPTRSSLETNAVDRVRHELLTALHFGKLTPGDRAPSVRGLARRTGMDKKTVHRAYTTLAREGLVHLRPGSGTFIADGLASAAEEPITELLSVANRCRATAAGLGLSPNVLGTFLDIYFGGGLRDLPLTVVECNEEQLGLIQTELESVFGVNVRSVLLSNFLSRPDRGLEGSAGLVTTDCHLAEVSECAAHLDRPIYRLALDPSFPQQIAEAARDSDVILVVRDQRFGPVFLGLLRQLAVAPERLRRIRVVEAAAARRLFREYSDDGATVCISPLVEAAVSSCVPDEFQRLRIRWHIEAASLRRLHVGMAFDLASRRLQPSVDAH